MSDRLNTYQERTLPYGWASYIAISNVQKPDGALCLRRIYKDCTRRYHARVSYRLAIQLQ